MRWALFPLLSLLPLGAAASSDRPVLVELFTSDACPACPAVDALIQKLTAPGAVPGAEVVALEWHTDTLNTEVWSDGLALPDGIRRQVDYLVRLIHMKSPVMPQIIVGGRQSLVGPEETDIRTAIAGDVHEPPFAISVSALSGNRVRVRCPSLPAGSSVFLAATESGLSTAIPNGAKAGQPIVHGPVVRWFKPLTLTKPGQVDATEKVPVGPDWVRAHVAFVAWAQNGDGGVLGVARVTQR